MASIVPKWTLQKPHCQAHSSTQPITHTTAARQSWPYFCMASNVERNSSSGFEFYITRQLRRMVVSDRARSMRLPDQKAIHTGKLSIGGPKSSFKSVLSSLRTITTEQPAIIAQIWYNITVHRLLMSHGHRKNALLTATLLGVL